MSDADRNTKKRPSGRFSRGKNVTGSRAQGRNGQVRDAMPPVRESAERLSEGQSFSRGVKVPRAPKVDKPKTRAGGARPQQRRMPSLKRVELSAPPEDAKFTDRDGKVWQFADSKLRRVAADILSKAGRRWRFRPFAFPIYTDRGNEQNFHFDFYIYDHEETVLRLILVLPQESREVWDKLGRFKRQYGMYSYEIWTPEKLHALQNKKTPLGF